MIDWKTMIKDKRFQLAAAVVGGAGVITLVRRRKAGADDAANAATAGGTGSAASGYQQGPGNTTGTDIAGFLSNYSSLLDGRLAEFGANQDEILKGLNTSGNGGNILSGIEYVPAPAHTGPLPAGTTWASLAQRYWGRDDAAAIDWFKFANSEKIATASGNLTGLNLWVPVRPPALT